jgi:hypothetical protein
VWTASGVEVVLFIGNRARAASVCVLKKSPLKRGLVANVAWHPPRSACPGFFFREIARPRGRHYGIRKKLAAGVISPGNRVPDSRAAFARHRIIQPAFSMAVAPFFGIPSFCVERNQS